MGAPPWDQRKCYQLFSYYNNSMKTVGGGEWGEGGEGGRGGGSGPVIVLANNLWQIDHIKKGHEGGTKMV